MLVQVICPVDSSHRCSHRCQDCISCWKCPLRLPACGEDAICRQSFTSINSSNVCSRGTWCEKVSPDQQWMSAGRRLTSWIRTASCLQLGVPCLPVTCFTDFELLILLLLELRLVAKHAELLKPNRGSVVQHPKNRLELL